MGGTCDKCTHVSQGLQLSGVLVRLPGAPHPNVVWTGPGVPAPATLWVCTPKCPVGEAARGVPQLDLCSEESEGPSPSADAARSSLGQACLTFPGPQGDSAPHAVCHLLATGPRATGVTVRGGRQRGVSAAVISWYLGEVCEWQGGSSVEFEAGCSGTGRTRQCDACYRAGGGLVRTVEATPAETSGEHSDGSRAWTVLEGELGRKLPAS